MVIDLIYNDVRSNITIAIKLKLVRVVFFGVYQIKKGRSNQ